MSQYGSDKPLLDARLQGVIYDNAPANTDTDFTFTFPFDCDFNGIDFYAWSSNKGDYITLSTEYDAGQYGWKRYKKFGKQWYVFPDVKERVILFPTKPSAGVRLKLTYHNAHASNSVDFAVNLFTFVDQQQINTGALEEGEDW